MKTFDISKNIILAFIILISIALKLSAHENTTSLISSDSVSIEKDKKVENISKRKVQNKTILCYERNKLNICKDIFVPFGSAIIGALSTLAGTFYWSKRTKKYHKETLKIELAGNL
ncbi:MAG: hypothetical protein HYV59_16960, partial [Planctomycetes bacterium]|nr:hypothetical protein [Planctomycetota bacterium]